MTRLIMRSCVVVLFFMLVLAAAPLWAASQEAKVVSTEWLQKNLSRPDIRIVDMKRKDSHFYCTRTVLSRL